jgi:hypothetical protein
MEREGERLLEREQEHATKGNAQVERIRAEAERIVNARVAAQPPTVQSDTVEKAKTVPFSVQDDYGDQESVVDTSGLLWWNSTTIDDYIPVNEYYDPDRQRQLRLFALMAPFCLNGISILTKKAQSMDWNVIAGRNLAKKWRDRISMFGGNFARFVARWVRAYSESDKHAVAELIRAAPTWAVDQETNQLTERGLAAMNRGADAAWEIVDARVMDPLCVWPLRSKEFPIVYRNPFTGYRHRLRDYQFMSITDMPSVDEKRIGYGICAVSRAVWAAQEDRMIQRFVYEKLSDNPGAGIVLANTPTKLLQTALEGARTERQGRGLVFYKGVIFLPVFDPSGNVSLEFLSFSGLPDEFNRQEVYGITKEIIATAFGLDVLEFGSIPAGGLGTGEQAEVAALKARGKGIGAIKQGIEAQFRQKLLPPTVEFELIVEDILEQKVTAEVHKTIFENAEKFAAIGRPDLFLQYLVDQEVVPQEYLEGEDITGRETLESTEASEKRWGPVVKMDSRGRVVKRWTRRMDTAEYVLRKAREKHARGEVDPDTLAQLALAEIAELRVASGSL